MFVLISDGECRVVINNGSGTYKPAAGDDDKGGDSLRHIRAVATFFSQPKSSIPIYAVTNEKGQFEVLDNQPIESCPYG